MMLLRNNTLTEKFMDDDSITQKTRPINGTWSLSCLNKEVSLAIAEEKQVLRAIAQLPHIAAYTPLEKMGQSKKNCTEMP